MTTLSPIEELFTTISSASAGKSGTEGVFIGWTDQTKGNANVRRLRELIDYMLPHLHDLQTHYSTWRKYIAAQLDLQPEDSWEDTAFINHELAAFDRLFHALAGCIVPVEEESPQSPTAAAAEPVCEDEGCPHYGTEHGHDPSSVVDYPGKGSFRREIEAEILPSFEEAWAATGYQYGADALENVRLGWDLARGDVKPRGKEPEFFKQELTGPVNPHLAQAVGVSGPKVGNEDLYLIGFFNADRKWAHGNIVQGKERAQKDFDLYKETRDAVKLRYAFLHEITGLTLVDAHIKEPKNAS